MDIPLYNQVKVDGIMGSNQMTMSRGDRIQMLMAVVGILGMMAVYLMFNYYY